MMNALIETLKVLAWASGGSFTVGVLTYEEAKALWEKKKKDVKVGNNTYLVKTSKGYGIKHFNTVIIDILPHDLYVLDNGGYYTPTTKARFDALSPVRVWSEKGGWIIVKQSSGWSGKKVPFEEGMIVDKDGEVVG